MGDWQFSTVMLLEGIITLREAFANYHHFEQIDFVCQSSLSLPKLLSSQILGVSWNMYPNPDEDPCSSKLFGQRARGYRLPIKKWPKHCTSVENGVPKNTEQSNNVSPRM